MKPVGNLLFGFEGNDMAGEKAQQMAQVSVRPSKNGILSAQAAVLALCSPGNRSYSRCRIAVSCTILKF
jgi:hypothetical protein